MKQFQKESGYANSRHKTFIIYGPNMSDQRKREASRQGYIVISTKEEMKATLAKQEITK